MAIGPRADYQVGLESCASLKMGTSILFSIPNPTQEEDIACTQLRDRLSSQLKT